MIELTLAIASEVSPKWNKRPLNPRSREVHLHGAAAKNTSSASIESKQEDTAIGPTCGANYCVPAQTPFDVGCLSSVYRSVHRGQPSAARRSGKCQLGSSGCVREEIFPRKNVYRQQEPVSQQQEPSRHRNGKWTLPTAGKRLFVEQVELGFEMKAAKRFFLLATDATATPPQLEVFKFGGRQILVQFNVNRFLFFGTTYQQCLIEKLFTK